MPIQSKDVYLKIRKILTQTFDIDNYDQWVGKWYAKLEQYYKSIL